MKIALIGYGNIANAIINGMLSSEKTKVMDDIYVFHALEVTWNPYNVSFKNQNIFDIKIGR